MIELITMKPTFFNIIIELIIYIFYTDYTSAVALTSRSQNTISLSSSALYIPFGFDPLLVQGAQMVWDVLLRCTKYQND